MADNEKEPFAEAMLEKEEATALSWVKMQEQIEGVGTYWLATARPEGRPHLVPVGAIWLDSVIFFTTGQGTRKEKNVQHDSHCVLAGSGPDYDVVVEGEAAKVTEEGLLQRVAEKYVAAGWPVTVGDGALEAPFSAPTTGPSPYEVYRVTPTMAFAFGTKDETVDSATRYRF